MIKSQDDKQKDSPQMLRAVQYAYEDCIAILFVRCIAKGFQFV
jgi:hypothetical protein